MIELIRNRKLHVNCIKPSLIVNAGLQLGRFRPLTLVYRPINNQAIEQILRQFFSITIKPVLVSLKNNCFYSDQLFKQTANNYKKTINTSTSFNFIERNKSINNLWPTQGISRYSTIRLSEFNYSQEMSKPAIKLLTSNREVPFEKQNTLVYSVSQANNSKPTQEKNDNGSYKEKSNKTYQSSNLKRQLSGIEHRVHTHNNFVNKTFESILKKEKSHAIEKSHIISGKYVHQNTEFYYSDLNGKAFIQDSKANKKTFFESDEELYLTRHKHSFATENHDAIKTDTRQIEKTLPNRIGFYQPKNKIQSPDVSMQTPGSSNSVDPNKLIDVDRLAQTVMQKINKTIRVERQRRGLL